MQYSWTFFFAARKYWSKFLPNDFGKLLPPRISCLDVPTFSQLPPHEHGAAQFEVAAAFEAV
jgi:hypothetical protein